MKKRSSSESFEFFKALIKNGFQNKRFRDLNHRTYLAGMKQVKVLAMFMPLMELISSLVIALIIWYGGGEALRKDISEKYNIMQAAMASWERNLDYMEYEKKGKDLPFPYENFKTKWLT